MEVDLKRLHDERKRKGFSQEYMAKAMGWKDRGVYAKRENGIVNISANELIRMAEILGYSKEEIGIFFKENLHKTEI